METAPAVPAVPSVPTSTTSTPETPSKPAKKSKTAAQLEALAKGREVKRQKALTRARERESSAGKVVRDDESANELLGRVRDADSEARITPRGSGSGGKRKQYDGFADFGPGNGTTVKVVAAAALLGGLAYLGSKGGLNMKGTAAPAAPSPPSEGPSGPSAGGAAPLAVASLSSQDYSY